VLHYLTKRDSNRIDLLTLALGVLALNDRRWVVWLLVSIVGGFLSGYLEEVSKRRAEAKAAEARREQAINDLWPC